MKKKLFFGALIATLMLTSVAAGAYGATNLQAIKANLNLGLKFKIDGNDWSPVDQNGKQIYAITYNGTTYLPIRSAGNALGVEVGWDGANNTVWLGEGAAEVEKNNGQGTVISKPNPVNLKTATMLEYEDQANNDLLKFKITVNEVIRGDAVIPELWDQNLNVEPLTEGYEYLAANITFDMFDTKSDSSFHQVNASDFKLTTNDSLAYESVTLNPPAPKITVGLHYKGAMHTGWAVFRVKIDDRTPLMSYSPHPGSDKIAWFKLY